MKSMTETNERLSKCPQAKRNAQLPASCIIRWMPVVTIIIYYIIRKNETLEYLYVVPFHISCRTFISCQARARITERARIMETSGKT
jgi:hypothetical protein